MRANPDRVPTDAELLAAVAEGDPEAFGLLYDQHAPWLLVRLRQRTADPDLADQVAQETFLVVWRDAGRFRGRGEVGAWIWGIAIRRLLSTHQTEDVVALCQQVLVLHLGKLRFAGTPLELAGLAREHVWQSQERDPGALAAWRTGTGQHRNIGNPPAGAALLEPTLEDGYLLLLGGDQVEEAAA